MSLGVVLAFLALSLFAYVVCGGADFGVGILEFFTPKTKRASVRKAGEHAIAPVWEANHVWLIVALVILFVGFPAVHVRLTTYLHIPLLLMLAGIIVRGTAFTFRYYDVGEDRPAERLWSTLFQTGSLLVPMTFGHLAASFSRGHLPATPTDVFATYLQPWLGWFPLAAGIFCTNLFAWLAAIFVVGEVSANERPAAIVRAKRCTLLLVFTSVLVAACALAEQVPWLARAHARPAGLLCGGFGLLSLALVWWSVAATVWRARVVAGLFVACVLGGYWGLSFPVALELQGQTQAHTLTWYEAAAPVAALDALAITLSLGALLIVPGLVWLYSLFKRAAPEERSAST